MIAGNSGYTPINDYALIGDRHTAALVSRAGSIDWCPLPRFDSPSVFGAILDAEKGGRFAVTPAGRFASTQRYLPDTNVIETTFETESGRATLTDFMPLFADLRGGLVAPHSIVRIVRGVVGIVTFALTFEPKPEYGLVEPEIVATSNAGEYRVAWGEGESLVLRVPPGLEIEPKSERTEFTAATGQELSFVAAYGTEGSTLEAGLAPSELLDCTASYWEQKVAGVEYQGAYRSEVTRSYLTLHLMTYAPSGGIVAAPTTSLPEWVGGVRNWDYRFTWLRDAAFTIEALLKLGHEDEALTFFDWLGRVCGLEEHHVHVLYRVDAEPDVDERTLPHLSGYGGSSPVRVGNEAFHQEQHDVFGEVLASAHLLAEQGQVFDDAKWGLLGKIASMAAEKWREPDNGIWEVRGGPFHFVYSKIMCWVALDRAARLAKLVGRDGSESAAWEREAEVIRDDVLRHGWSESKQAFVQHYHSEAMDASNLLIPLVGFLPFDDPRVISTIARIRTELGNGPFLKRYNPEETDDGVYGEEGHFLLCSFWLVQALARMGRLEEARFLFRQLSGYANHVGLFGEMVDPRDGSTLGNFPQAFTHIGFILAARDMSFAGSIESEPGK